MPPRGVLCKIRTVMSYDVCSNFADSVETHLQFFESIPFAFSRPMCSNICQHRNSLTSTKKGGVVPRQPTDVQVVAAGRRRGGSEGPFALNGKSWDTKFMGLAASHLQQCTPIGGKSFWSLGWAVVVAVLGGGRRTCF